MSTHLFEPHPEVLWGYFLLRGCLWWSLGGDPVVQVLNMAGSPAKKECSQSIEITLHPHAFYRQHCTILVNIGHVGKKKYPDLERSEGLNS